ncbi:hypothetical protein [Maridesulfovibrio sp. FT414]|uniref:hypothetical protein n=1 Tax=Maridesulfovibrio sp. FT414 TaxID=2979469 RepID=UPI003D802CFF
MSDERFNNPEESWAELVKEFGNDHKPLSPGLSDAFLSAPYSLMWQVSWYKFAGKMIGNRGTVLVYDHLEGLGGWTVACEVQGVHAVLKEGDNSEMIAANWDFEKIRFLGFDDAVSSEKYAGIVCFDPDARKDGAQWESFFRDSASLIHPDGVVVAGGSNAGLDNILKEAAKKSFKHVFMFGRGQIHPCVSPAEVVILLACGLLLP